MLQRPLYPLFIYLFIYLFIKALPCAEGSLEPAAIRLTLERLQESARQSGCFFLVNFIRESHVCRSTTNIISGL